MGERVRILAAIIGLAIMVTVVPARGADALSGFFELFNQDAAPEKDDAAKKDAAAPAPAQPPVAQPDAAKPGDAKPDGANPDAAKPEPPGEPLRIIITGLQGIVRLRMAEDQPWQKPAVGMVIPQGAEFQTGPRSAVRIKIGDDQELTLDRLGTIKVLRAIEQKDTNTIKTDVGMPYGRTNYKIEPAGPRHESTIRAPSTTLAIRGSDVTYQDDALGAMAIGQGKLALVIRDVQRTSRSFGSNIRATIAANRNGSADTARGAGTADPRGRFVARTDLEQTRTEELPAVGGEDLRALRDIRLGEIFFKAGVSIPGNVGATTIFAGTPNVTQVAVSIISPADFAVSLENPLSPNGRVSLIAEPPNGIAGPDGTGAQVIALNVSGLTSPVTLTYSIDLRSNDVTPVLIPVFQILESLEGQAPKLINDLANPPIPPTGIILTPGQRNFTTSVTIPSTLATPP